MSWRRSATSPPTASPTAAVATSATPSDRRRSPWPRSRLPTRGFDTTDQLEDRLARADRAFALAFDLGTRTVLVRAGGVPPEADPRRPIFASAVEELARRADRHGVILALETGPDPGPALREILDAWANPHLAASLDPAALLAQGHDPIASTLALGPWVAHAYANDASAGGGVAAANPRGFGFRPGVLDWEEYLGALEEIGYAGFLTLWPDANAPMARQVAPLLERFRKF